MGQFASSRERFPREHRRALTLAAARTATANPRTLSVRVTSMKKRGVWDKFRNWLGLGLPEG
jgi:hypothetical protein